MIRLRGESICRWSFIQAPSNTILGVMRRYLQVSLVQTDRWGGGELPTPTLNNDTKQKLMWGIEKSRYRWLITWRLWAGDHQSWRRRRSRVTMPVMWRHQVHSPTSVTLYIPLNTNILLEKTPRLRYSRIVISYLSKNVETRIVLASVIIHFSDIVNAAVLEYGRRRCYLICYRMNQ